MNNPRINIFLLPATNKNNKYIDLFSSSLKASDQNVHIYSLEQDNLVRVFPYLTSADQKGVKNIIHIHWPTVLYGSRFFLKSLFLLTKNFFLLCIFKYFYKIKIVWTVHNFYAHDYPHPIIDKMGQCMIRFFADLITVQQKSTLEAYSKKYPKKNIQFVPHGDFIDAYGPLVERDADLRKSLGFANDDILLLSLGAVSPYKMNESIIDVIDSASQIKFLICGKGTKEYIEQLKIHAAGNKKVVIREGFVPDEEIPRYLSIADYSVFYYDTSEMTSGGIIHSLSYGVPVITRDIPASEIISTDNGFLFKNQEGLRKILEDGQLRKKFDKNVVIDSIREYDRMGTAKKLIDLYRKLK
mgnify:FL=1